jgi:hypothetical protein
VTASKQLDRLLAVYSVEKRAFIFSGTARREEIEVLMNLAATF